MFAEADCARFDPRAAEQRHTIVQQGAPLNHMNAALLPPRRRQVAYEMSQLRSEPSPLERFLLLRRLQR